MGVVGQLGWPCPMGHLFYDLEGIVPRIDGVSDLVSEIDKLFYDFGHYRKVVASEKKFIEENSWSKIAKKYISVV
jgi:hypothetical protein